MFQVHTYLTQQQRSEIPTRKATLMPLHETVNVIIGSDEQIFEENFCYAINPMNRVIKVRKEALSYGQQ
jgi:hypothetical protein